MPSCLQLYLKLLSVITIVILRLSFEFAMTDLGSHSFFLDIDASRFEGDFVIINVSIRKENPSNPSNRKSYLRLIIQPIIHVPQRWLRLLYSGILLEPYNIWHLLVQISLCGIHSYGLHLHLSHASCPQARPSTFEFYVYLDDDLTSWSSTLQHVVCHSSNEAEYGVAILANSKASTRAVLSSHLCCGCFFVTISTPKTKHLEIDLRFVSECVAIGHVRVLHVPSAPQLSYIFTKKVFLYSYLWNLETDIISRSSGMMRHNVDTSVPEYALRIFFARAPEATLPIVSLADDRPPPYISTCNSASEMGILGGQPSMVQPTPPPWDSPNVVTRKHTEFSTGLMNLPTADSEMQLQPIVAIGGELRYGGSQSVDLSDVERQSVRVHQRMKLQRRVWLTEKTPFISCEETIVKTKSIVFFRPGNIRHDTKTRHEIDMKLAGVKEKKREKMGVTCKRVLTIIGLKTLSLECPFEPPSKMMKEEYNKLT
ncbi:hypothetical protein LXL04_012544 [Taraxacum kok-saghyz]